MQDLTLTPIAGHYLPTGDFARNAALNAFSKAGYKFAPDAYQPKVWDPKKGLGESGMSSLDEHLMARFKSICDEIASREDSYSDDIETSYSKLLQLLATETKSRQLLLNELAEIVRSYRHARGRGRLRLSVEALAYCMHELRWPEILEVAFFEHDDFFSKRMDQTLIRLIDAFQDDWDRAVDYVRFRKGD